VQQHWKPLLFTVPAVSTPVSPASPVSPSTDHSKSLPSGHPAIFDGVSASDARSELVLGRVTSGSVSHSCAPTPPKNNWTRAVGGWHYSSCTATATTTITVTQTAVMSAADVTAVAYENQVAQAVLNGAAVLAQAVLLPTYLVLRGRWWRQMKAEGEATSRGVRLLDTITVLALLGMAGHATLGLCGCASVSDLPFCSQRAQWVILRRVQ